ncbi:MAG: DUF4124 domain-containing protein [Burkholderiales bacterium]
MRPNLLHIICFLLCFIGNEAVDARTYKWVDDDGVTHYGDSIPAEYQDRANTEINSRGVTLKKNEGAATPEQRKAREEELARKKQEAEARRRDNLLVSSYANVEEIDLARERNLQQVNLVIRNTQARLKNVQTDLDASRKLAESYTRLEQSVPEQLQADIAAIQQNELDLENAIAQKRKEAGTIRAHFDQDKKRYIELTQDAPAAGK